jgi:phage shock protein PspC (stress-responsive transcriptional regulator)
MIAGVSGGLAEYFDVDPVIVRVCFIASFFFWGFSCVIYVILWMIVPNENPSVAFTENTVFDSESSNSDNKKTMACEHKSKAKDKTYFVFAVALIAIGTLMLIDRIVPSLDSSIILSSLLIICGLAMILKPSKKQESNR